MTYRDDHGAVDFAAALDVAHAAKRAAADESTRTTAELRAALKDAARALAISPQRLGWAQFIPYAPDSKYGEHHWHEPLRRGIVKLSIRGSVFGEIEVSGDRWVVDGVPTWSASAAVAAVLSRPRAADAVARERREVVRMRDEALQHFATRRLSREMIVVSLAICGLNAALLVADVMPEYMGPVLSGSPILVVAACLFWIGARFTSDWISGGDAEARLYLEEYEEVRALETARGVLPRELVRCD